MFYDFNIPRPSSKVESTLLDIIDRAVKYGYGGFAITTGVDEKIFEKSKKEKKKKNLVIEEVENMMPLPIDLTFLKTKYPGICFYNRINITISDNNSIRKFIQTKELKKFDLISFQPENQAVLKALTGIAEIDILSYNPENKCDLSLNRKLYNQFVNQNVYFELIYAPGIADATARRNLLTLSHVYKAVGKSKNIVVSSGAQFSHLIRGPYDVINFNLLFGLSEEQAKSSISKNCEKLLLRAKRQRCSKACIKMVKMNKKKEDCVSLNQC